MKTKECETKIFDFTNVTIQNIKGDNETHDISQLIGNVLYNSCPDIGAMDSAREIYHKGKTQLSKQEAQYFARIIMESPALAAPLKIAVQNIFNN